jgi:hypothetical protein
VSGEKYVLLKWKDGWQEVVRIDGDAVGFDKYFVIERKEYFGRLVYKMPEGKYPGLVVIDRAPMEKLNGSTRHPLTRKETESSIILRWKTKNTVWSMMSARRSKKRSAPTVFQRKIFSLCPKRSDLKRLRQSPGRLVLWAAGIKKTLSALSG